MTIAYLYSRQATSQAIPEMRFGANSRSLTRVHEVVKMIGGWCGGCGSLRGMSGSVEPGCGSPGGNGGVGSGGGASGAGIVMECQLD